MFEFFWQLFDAFSSNAPASKNKNESDKQFLIMITV